MCMQPLYFSLTIPMHEPPKETNNYDNRCFARNWFTSILNSCGINSVWSHLIQMDINRNVIVVNCVFRQNKSDELILRLCKVSSNQISNIIYLHVRPIFHWKQWTFKSQIISFVTFSPRVLFIKREKGEISDSVLWKKPLHPQKIPKCNECNVTTQKRH